MLNMNCMIWILKPFIVNVWSRTVWHVSMVGVEFTKTNFKHKNVVIIKIYETYIMILIRRLSKCNVDFCSQMPHGTNIA